MLVSYDCWLVISRHCAFAVTTLHLREVFEWTGAGINFRGSSSFSPGALRIKLERGCRRRCWTLHRRRLAA
jgi:hypothetical protein